MDFNNTKPNGMPKKLLDSSIINKLGWESKIPIFDGIESLYSWYKKQNIQN